jgi:hypothetical protein
MLSNEVFPAAIAHTRILAQSAASLKSAMGGELLVDDQLWSLPKYREILYVM